MDYIEIEGKKIGKDNPVFIIAEIGLNHNGNPNIAKDLVAAASRTKADCAKFQKRTVDQLAIREVLDREDNRFPELGRTYRELRSRHELEFDDFKTLKDECKKNGMTFLCTAFDTEAADFLDELGVSAYKIASHSLTNTILLDHIGKKGKPVILSTGMATLTEVDNAVDLLKKHEVQLMLNHCVSSYPQSPKDSSLRLIGFLVDRYSVPVGYSGHEIGLGISTLAVAAGACAIERHITLDKNMQGFDHRLSLDEIEFADLVNKIREIEEILGKSEKKLLESEKPTRMKYHVSIVSKVPIRKGEVITLEKLTAKNPGTGISLSEIDKVVGRRAAMDIEDDKLIEWRMLR